MRHGNCIPVQRVWGEADAVLVSRNKKKVSGGGRKARMEADP